MKLIQLNAWAGRMHYVLGKFMQEQKADIFVMQEILSSPEGKTYYFDVLQNMQMMTQMPHHFFTPLTGNQYGSKMTYCGNAILSQHELADPYQEYTHLCYKGDWDADCDSDDVKAFQHVKAMLPGGTHVNLVNYHGFNTDLEKRGNEVTAAHCQRIAEFVDNLEGPVIVAGDFNLAPDSESLAPLNSRLRNLCDEYNVVTTRNKFAYTMTPVDYIWTSRDIGIRHFEVLRDEVSDHAPLLLEFDI